MKNKHNICVFGASSSNIDRAFFDDAYEVGRLIASSGFGLVFGAGDSGLMGSAARGCRDAGGNVYGVIPKKLNVPGIYYEDCTKRIETATMHERKAAMEAMSCGFIAMGGGFGTIEEFMEVLTLKQLGYMDTAIVLLNTCGYFDFLIAQLEKCVSCGFTHGDFSTIYHVAQTPAEAVNYCINYKGMNIRDKLKDAVEKQK